MKYVCPKCGGRLIRQTPVLHIHSIDAKTGALSKHHAEEPFLAEQASINCVKCREPIIITTDGPRLWEDFDTPNGYPW